MILKREKGEIIKVLFPGKKNKENKKMEQIMLVVMVFAWEQKHMPPYAL